MAWRNWLIRQGATNIAVIAVWSKDLPRVYNAYDVARQLQYTNYHSGDPRRQLDHHLDEFLICHSIHADEYRILAIFYGNISEEFVSFSLQDLQHVTSVPSNFAQSITTKTNTREVKDATDELRLEMYSLTRVQGDSKFYPLVLSIGDIPYRLLSNGNITTITYLSPLCSLQWYFQRV